jgi:predicted 3-demethylubiquinone-9 3-methyltransferase (glyoxalase superfamily)
MPNLMPMLWFDTQAKEAAEFYCSIFPNSSIKNISHYGDTGPGAEGKVMTVDFVLDGLEITGLNGGPEFKFTEAISLVINCKDQAEIDYYWDALLAGGGEESMCGWLKDKFGLSWQVVPESMGDLMTSPDPERSNRAMKAMFTMRKLDIAALKAAADGA